MTRKTLRIISGISLGILIPASFSTITSCSSKNNGNVLNYNYSWEDVNGLENQMINEVERKAKNNYESNFFLQKQYTNEDVYVLEQAQEYQSNLDLDLIKWKSQKGRTSTDIYNLLDERASNDSLSTLNWKFINDTSKNILSTFNSAIDSQFSDLSALERAEFKNQLNSKYNDLMYKAQRKNYGKNDTFGYIRSELNTYIDSLIAKEASKLRAKNTLHDFLLSSEFSINPILLSQPKNNSDIVVSLHNWELASDSEKKQIENSLFPLLAKYKNLPVNSETLFNEEQNQNFLLNLSINSLEWTDPFDASLTITIHILDSNSNEELASQQLKDIEIEDNIEGIKVAANQIIDYVTLDLKSNPASYSAFKNSAVNNAPSQQTNIFVTQSTLSQIIDFDITDAISAEQKLSIYKLQSNNEFNFGAYVNFNDNSTDDFGGFVTVTPCLYTDSKNEDSDTPYTILTDTVTKSNSSIAFGLPRDPSEEEQGIYIDELSSMSFYQSLSYVCDQYDYFSNDQNKQECQKTLNDVNSTIEYGVIAYAVIGVASVVSIIADVVAQSWGWLAFDIAALLVFDGLAGYADFSILLPMKNSAQEELDRFNAVRSSDEYKTIQELVTEKNLHQYTKDVFNSISDFIVKDTSCDSVYDIKQPEDLLKDYSSQNISFKVILEKLDKKIKEIFSSTYAIFGQVATAFCDQIKTIVQTIGSFKSLPDRWEFLEIKLCKSFQTALPNFCNERCKNATYHCQSLNCDYKELIQNLLGVGWKKKDPLTDTDIILDSFLKEKADNMHRVISKYTSSKISKDDFYLVFAGVLGNNGCNFEYSGELENNFLEKIYLHDDPYNISNSELLNIMDDFHTESAADFPKRMNRLINVLSVRFGVEHDDVSKVQAELTPYTKNWAQEAISIRNKNLKNILADPKQKRVFITVCLQAEDYNFYDSWSRCNLQWISTRKQSLRYKVLEKKFSAVRPYRDFSEINFPDTNIAADSVFFNRSKLDGIHLYSKRVSIVSPSYSTDIDRKYFTKSNLFFNNRVYKMTEEEDQICLQTVQAIYTYNEDGDIVALYKNLQNIRDKHASVFNTQPATCSESKYNSYVTYEQEEFLQFKKVRIKLIAFSVAVLGVGILSTIIGTWLQAILKNKISNIVEKM